MGVVSLKKFKLIQYNCLFLMKLSPPYYYYVLYVAVQESYSIGGRGWKCEGVDLYVK